MFFLGESKTWRKSKFFEKTKQLPIVVLHFEIGPVDGFDFPDNFVRLY